MEVKSIHRKGYTITVVPKALSLGLAYAKEAHTLCKLLKIREPSIHNNFTIAYAMKVHKSDENYYTYDPHASFV